MYSKIIMIPNASNPKIKAKSYYKTEFGATDPPGIFLLASSPFVDWTLTIAVQ